MLQAAVYSNQKTAIDKLTELIRDYAQQNDSDAIIKYSLFTSLSSFEEAIHEKNRFNIFILDGEKGNTITIKEAQKLGENADKFPTILLLHSEENLLQAKLDCPNVHVFLISDKDDFRKSLYEVIEQAYKNIALSQSQTNIQSISIKSRDGQEKILYSEILSIEYTQKRLLFHLQNSKDILSLTIRIPMEEMLENLLKDKRFIRVHRALS